MRRYELQPVDGHYVPTEAEAQTPEPRAGEVLIRVRAASLNYRDHLIAAKGILGDKARGVVPLSDGAGEVEAVGSGVTRWRKGDRVAANFFPTWVGGRFDMRYHDAALGGSHPGMLSEYVVLPQDALVRVPDHLNFEEASTLPCAALTAWQGLFERGRVEAGDTVLTAGTGGVSVFALQLAKAAGARVIITSSSDGKLDRARSLGADVTINYSATPEWDREVLRVTDGRGADHVMEIGGTDTYTRSLACVEAGGHVHQLGVLTGFALTPDLWPVAVRNATVHGLYVGSVEMFERMNAFITRHTLRPVIDRVVPFDAAREAYHLIATGGHFGKIVIGF